MPPRQFDRFRAHDESVDESGPESGPESGDAAGGEPESVADDSEMVARRVPNGDRVTTVRMEAAYWSALEEIAAREDLMVNEICRQIALASGGRRLREALRAYAVRYFRAAANGVETGHPPPPLRPGRA